MIVQLSFIRSKVKLFRKDSIANPEDAELIPELLTDDATELEVISSFSVDIGGMDARVIVTDCNSLSQLTREPTTVVKSASSLDSFMVSPPGVSPWRDSLLEKLRQPAAAPLVKEIKRLLKYLELETVSTENRSKTVQRFYEDSRAMLQSSPAWNMLERDELDGSMDVIEKYIFAKCFSVVYQPADSDDAVQDKLFIEKINSLSDVVKFSSLCVALENIVEDDPSLDRYTLSRIIHH